MGPENDKRKHQPKADRPGFHDPADQEEGLLGESSLGGMLNMKPAQTNEDAASPHSDAQVSDQSHERNGG